MRKAGWLLAVLAVLLYQSLLPPAALAFETRRVVLVGPVDTAGYKSEAVDALISGAWKRVFRYPFYEVVAELRGVPAAGEADLAELARASEAEIIAAAEIVRLDDHTYQRGLWDDSETWQDIRLELSIKTYDASAKAYQAFRVKRQQSQPLSVNSGPEPLIADAMDEVLARIAFKRVPE